MTNLSENYYLDKFLKSAKGRVAQKAKNPA
jgi:hypothetical protein